jgi:hypothetical protein
MGRFDKRSIAAVGMTLEKKRFLFLEGAFDACKRAHRYIAPALAVIGGRSQMRGEIIVSVMPVGDQIDQDDRLHPLPVTAKRLGISVWTLRYWIQCGQVESHKLFGRRLIAESEIRRLIEQSRVPARACLALKKEKARESGESLATTA